MKAWIDPVFARRLKQLEKKHPSMALARPDLPRTGDFARFESLTKAQASRDATGLVPTIITNVIPRLARQVLREHTFLRSDVRVDTRRNGTQWLARNGILLLRGGASVEAIEWMAESLGGRVYDGEARVGLPMPRLRSVENDWDWQRRAIGDDERLLALDDLGRDVSIAVLDTGVAALHAAFAGDTVTEMDFTGEGGGDLHGHGTHCCGIATGKRIKSGNAVMFRGIATAARRYSGKCLDSNGSGTLTGVVQAVAWAAELRVDVISMSLGGRSDGTGQSPVAQVVDRAWESGCVVVVAAGNEGPGRGTIATPGDSRLAITVGAYDSKDVIAPFSSRGPTAVPGEGGQKPNVVGPGVRILSAALPTDADDRPLISFSGTSMATPCIAGLCAALIGMEPSLRRNPEGVKRALVEMCRNIGNDPLVNGAGAPCLVSSPIVRRYRRGRGANSMWFGTIARAAAVLTFGAGCAIVGAYLSDDGKSDDGILGTARDIGGEAHAELCERVCFAENSVHTAAPSPLPRTADERSAPSTREVVPRAEPAPERPVDPAPDRAVVATPTSEPSQPGAGAPPRLRAADLVGDPGLTATERNRRVREALLAR